MSRAGRIRRPFDSESESDKSSVTVEEEEEERDMTLDELAAMAIADDGDDAAPSPVQSVEQDGVDDGVDGGGETVQSLIQPIEQNGDDSSNLVNGTAESPQSKTKIPLIRASKLEYKSVSQIWDRKSYGFKIVESLDNATRKKDKYEEYIFIVRRQYDEQNMHFKTFVDIKSELLRDILRQLLQGVNTVSLRVDKPEIRLEILFHYLPQLESWRNAGPLGSDKETQHLDLLIRYLQENFASVITDLPPLLEHGEITFDLLWTLFRPNTIVYTRCIFSEEPKCLIFDFGDEKEIKKEKYYVLQCRYVDFNGKVFGEVATNLIIPEFRGAKTITSLQIHPLQYHPEMAKIKSDLIKRGQKFTTLKGVHHCAYQGLAHIKNEKGQPVKFTTKGRIMVDPVSFKDHNPNYERPRIDILSMNDLRGVRSHVLDNIIGDGLVGRDVLLNGTAPNAKGVLGSRIDSLTKEGKPSNGAESEQCPEDIEDSDLLLICSPTVLGFSLDRHVWAEFAVSAIQDITWTNLPFDTLVIPPKKKDMLQALIHHHRPKEGGVARFDDFVEGKGQGLIVLLHGPPGVGKTLTAEAISEYQKVPLFRVCAGDLGLDDQRLEDRLSKILDLVNCWNAILLLDEADVFLETREHLHLQHNTLVSIFLRQLEYFQGVMILTTNRVTVFDEAVQSRIHLGIKYDPLSKKAKEEIWTAFLRQANNVSEKEKKSQITPDQLEDLSRRHFNGRQIKNTVRMAHAFAVSKGVSLGYEHLIRAIEANEDFDNDFRGNGKPNNSYL